MTCDNVNHKGGDGLSRRARVRWACVSSSPQEETQAQRARARRDKAMDQTHSHRRSSALRASAIYNVNR